MRIVIFSIEKEGKLCYNIPAVCEHKMAKPFTQPFQGRRERNNMIGELL